LKKENLSSFKSKYKKAETQLMRLGYFEKEQETQIYKERRRNRLVPVFYMKDRPIIIWKGS
jgi:hypothetical protein